MSVAQPLLRAARARVATSLRLTSRRTLHTLPGRAVNYAPLSFIWGAAALVVSAGVYARLAPTIHLDSAPASTQLHDDDSDSIIDPETSIAFPKTLRIPSKTPIPTMTLLGVGVRRVSLLKVKVYSIGFYADLENPKLKIPVSSTPEEKIEYIIRNTGCVVRIVPTRTTGYTHLRDAFMRALQARMGLAKQHNTLSEEEAQAVGSPMRKLKTLFPNTPINQGTPLDIYIPAPIQDRPRPLIFRDLGSVESDWVANELALHYLEGMTSPPLKKMVVENLESLKK